MTGDGVVAAPGWTVSVVMMLGYWEAYFMMACTAALCMLLATFTWTLVSSLMLNLAPWRVVPVRWILTRLLSTSAVACHAALLS
eukprot:495376-Pyramimonas_sp.AAC.1